MANYTEQLNLKKPESDDFYNIEDFNDNFDILDEEISLKSNKLTDFTSGNLVCAKSDGDISDSGYSVSDFLENSITYSDIGAEKAGEASKVQASLLSHTQAMNMHLTSVEKEAISKMFTTDDIVVSSTQPTAVEGRIWIKID